jgi:hypothetical protein
MLFAMEKLMMPNGCGKTCHVVNHIFTPKSKHERMQVWWALKQWKTNVKWNGEKSQAIFKMLLEREGVHVHYFTLAYGASNKKGCCLICRSLEVRKGVLTVLCGPSFFIYK